MISTSGCSIRDMAAQWRRMAQQYQEIESVRLMLTRGSSE